MFSFIAPTLILLVTASSTSLEQEKYARETAIERCAATAEMLASAYAAHPGSDRAEVDLRTKLINQGRERLESQIGITDRHVTSAYVALAFYDGDRTAGVIPKDAPIDSNHLAAKGAAYCMASTYGSAL